MAANIIPFPSNPQVLGSTSSASSQTPMLKYDYAAPLPTAQFPAPPVNQPPAGPLPPTIPENRNNAYFYPTWDTVPAIKQSTSGQWIVSVGNQEFLWPYPNAPTIIPGANGRGYSLSRSVTDKTWNLQPRLPTTVDTKAFSLDLGPANEWRGQQQQQAQQLQQVVAGTADSAAQRQLQQGMDRNIQSAMAVGATIRPGAAAGAAAKDVADRTASIQAQTSGEAAVLRAQESAQAREQLLSLTAEARAADLQTAMSQAELSFNWVKVQMDNYWRQVASDYDIWRTQVDATVQGQQLALQQRQILGDMALRQGAFGLDVWRTQADVNLQREQLELQKKMALAPVSYNPPAPAGPPPVPPPPVVQQAPPVAHPENPHSATRPPAPTGGVISYYNKWEFSDSPQAGGVLVAEDANYRVYKNGKGTGGFIIPKFNHSPGWSAFWNANWGG